MSRYKELSEAYRKVIRDLTRATSERETAEDFYYNPLKFITERHAEIKRLAHRSVKSAKNAGTAFETLVAGYLAEHVNPVIERRAKNGVNDRGDISGLTTCGERVVIECKNYGGSIHAKPWITEAENEAGNDDAAIPIVVAKRAATNQPGDQWVLMTLETLVTILTGDTKHIKREGGRQ